MNKFRVYADTSVFGGCFDKEFSITSLEFIKQVEKGIYKLIISPVLLAELNDAPIEVRNILSKLPEECYEILLFTDEIIKLRNKYIESGIKTSITNLMLNMWLLRLFQTPILL